MIRLTAILFTLTLAGCAAQMPAPSLPAPGTGDQCAASQMQYLVGQNRSGIPPEPAGATWRVACTTCAVTMDYNPRRLNIFFDERTGVIREVRCG